MTRRSYDQYCPIARALDAVGDRWALLVVRELTAGPRRYTDLHADLPGVSTDMLAARLRDLEREQVVSRRKLPPPAAAQVYELTERGRRLLPVLTELADWGAADLAEPRPTDAVRAHWFAVPLLRALRAEGMSVLTQSGESGDPARTRPTALPGVIDVELPEGVFHVLVGPDLDLSHADGRAPAADATLVVSAAARLALVRGETRLADCLADGGITLTVPSSGTMLISM